MIMPKNTIAKKESRDNLALEVGLTVANIHDRSYLIEAIAEHEQLHYSAIRKVLLHELGHILGQQKLVKRSEELACAWLYAALASSSSQQSYRTAVERRLSQLERATSTHTSVLETLKTHIGLVIAEEQYKEQQWPAFASEEFGKIFENTKGLENAGEDKGLLLYHVMEIESLLGKVERKARATNREYGARLASSLRDICKIHEPSELSDEQIKCFAASLQALIEGWGALNRDKVKWIRGRLLEVGLTWLPVTEKAQKVIDEAKSSVK